MEPELYRLKGELLLMRDESDVITPEKCFRFAIDTARRHSGRSRELRATTALAKLLRVTGRRGEAHQILAEIYGWFTEGSDTADLKDAKAVLDESRS